MKKCRIIMAFLFCMVLVSGCNKETMKKADGTDNQTVKETDIITDSETVKETNINTDSETVKEIDKIAVEDSEMVFKFPEEDIQSLFVHIYDFEGSTSTSNWVYEKEDMNDFINYLKNLSGIKVKSINPDDLTGLFYGVELSGEYPYTILFVGDYAVNYEGEYYLIDKDEAVKMCESIIGNTRVYDSIYNIVNHRYLSLIDGKWNTKYMNKSVRTDAPLENAQMVGDSKAIHAETETLNLSIENTTSSRIEFGSPMELETMIDEVWYNIDNMINDNINLGWTDLLYILEAGKSTDAVFYFTCFQPLPTGRYRLIKEINSNDKMGYTSFEFNMK